jgi:hypothetical protein
MMLRPVFHFLIFLSLGLFSVFLGRSAQAAGAKSAVLRVEVVARKDQNRVDVMVEKKPFTSYLWSAGMIKPLLFPITAATGTVITRGFPIAPRPGEQKDHPHQVGLSMTYGDVDGADFWNNKGEYDDEPKGKHPAPGMIVHRSVDEVRGGRGQGTLTASSDWVMPDGRVAFHEKTRFVFHAGEKRRAIDRIGTWTAPDKQVRLPDNKEGMLALRVANSLELPQKKKNPDGTGKYLSSEGVEGEEVWGKRARWLMLTGQVEGETVTIAILDHPTNPGFPTYWHARPYGLFAANPLGQQVFSEGKERLNFSIGPGASIRWAHRVVVLSGGAAPRDIEAEYQAFLREVK